MAKRAETELAYTTFEFVLGELVRHIKMPRSEWLATAQKEPFEALSRLDGSIVVVGSEALRRIAALATHAVERSSFRGQVGTADVQRQIGRELVEAFVERREHLTEALAQRIVSRALATAAKKRENLIHYIPCHLVADSTPTGFDVGPVHFAPMPDFLNMVHADLQAKEQETTAAALAAWLKPDQPEQETERLAAQAREHAEWFTKETTSYFGQFDWVADVRIDGFISSLSRERAESCVEAALDFLRVLIGAAYSQRFRLDTNPLRPPTSASLYREASSGGLAIAVSQNSPTISLGDGWWETLVEYNGERLKTAGACIECLRRPSPLPPLAARLTDACKWFGQAVRDPLAGTRIVKYVSAIERLTYTYKPKPEDKDGVRQTVSHRAALLCCEGAEDFADWKERALKVYDSRSDMVPSRVVLELGVTQPPAG